MARFRTASEERGDARPPGPAVADDLLGGASRLILDAVQANVFVADPGLNLVYMNAKAAETMRGIGGEVEKAFRVKLADVLGGSIHRFHKDPERIERILHSPSFRPHHAEFTFGNVTLEAEINRVSTPDGTLLGYVVAWQEVSERVAAERKATAFAERLGEVQQVSVAVQAVASATEEMVASIQEIARNSGEASHIVTQAVDTVASANTTMAQLGEASTQISTIVNTITSVAEQTNLLALNATIESARAGEAGRGFAVVAGEVKELSQQTRSATEEINRMIEGIQVLSQDAIGAIEQISRVVERINQNQASIAGAVEEQTATSNAISANLVTAARQAEEIADFVRANRS
jgi:hypothetical protein